jgi:hypothetical protein
LYSCPPSSSSAGVFGYNPFYLGLFLLTLSASLAFAAIVMQAMNGNSKIELELRIQEHEHREAELSLTLDELCAQIGQMMDDATFTGTTSRGNDVLSEAATESGIGSKHRRTRKRRSLVPHQTDIVGSFLEVMVHHDEQITFENCSFPCWVIDLDKLINQIGTRLIRHEDARSEGLIEQLTPFTRAPSSGR